LREGTGWLEAALSRAGTPPVQTSSGDPAHLANAYYALGRLMHELGNNVSAGPILESSLQFWRQTIPLNKTGVAYTLNALGWLRRQNGELGSARALQEQAITLFRETAEQAGLAGALVELALILREQEDFERARLAADEGESIYRLLDDERGIASALCAIGLIAKREGDYTSAIPLFELALTTFRKIGARTRVPYMLHNMATLMLSLDDVPRATAFNQQGAELFRELGNKDGIVHSLYLAGHMALFQNDVAGAETDYRRAAELVREGAAVGWLRGGCLFGLAMIEASRGRYERAARLWGAAEKQRKIASSYWDAAERRLHARTIAVAEARLGKTTFETICAEGDSLTLEQAVDYALSREEA
jgi:tetratricopeptide (TPR) repeat protein